jgi:hypothetical protein
VGPSNTPTSTAATPTLTATRTAPPTNTPTKAPGRKKGGGGCAIGPANAGMGGGSLLWLALPAGLLLRRRHLGS